MGKVWPGKQERMLLWKEKEWFWEGIRQHCPSLSEAEETNSKSACWILQSKVINDFAKDSFKGMVKGRGLREEEVRKWTVKIDNSFKKFGIERERWQYQKGMWDWKKF